jgi:hypothetical protein
LDRREVSKSREEWRERWAVKKTRCSWWMEFDFLSLSFALLQFYKSDVWKDRMEVLIKLNWNLASYRKTGITLP